MIDEKLDRAKGGLAGSGSRFVLSVRLLRTVQRVNLAASVFPGHMKKMLKLPSIFTQTLMTLPKND